MSTGDAFELKVKNAATGKWEIVGPGPCWGFFYQSTYTVDRDAKFYQDLGLKTKIRKFEMEYDDR